MKKREIGIEEIRKEKEIEIIEIEEKEIPGNKGLIQKAPKINIKLIIIRAI